MDLPGHGSRGSDDIRRITREYYVEAVVTPAQLNRLSHLTLVVHSFAATLVPQLVERLGDALERIVFIGGVLPPSGKLPISALSASQRLRARLFKASEHGIGVPGSLGKGVPVRKGNPDLVPEPYLPWMEPADPARFPASISLDYIVLTRDRVVSPKLQRGYAQALPSAQVLELEAGNQAPLTHQVEIVDVLLSGVPPRPPEEETAPEEESVAEKEAVAEGTNE